MNTFSFNPIQSPNKNAQNGIKYVAIGDSYTIGLGVEEENNWPNILVRNLNEKGIKVNLVDNPAVSGFTVRDAIEYELPIVEKLKPDFVTVLIGANDNFRENSRENFQRDLTELLNKLQFLLKEKGNIILITIPDHSKSPAVRGTGRDELTDFIAGYNEIIIEEGRKRGLKVADIFPVSQTMMQTDDYIFDGLHPSSSGYAKWEKVIFPVVYDFLSNR